MGGVTETRASRPLPRPDDASAAFWEACARRELRIQSCDACGRRRFPPRPMCPACRSFASSWLPAQGLGTVFSYVICHPPLLPAFRELAPLAVVVVELADDPTLRMIGNLLGCAADAARIGLPVEVCFEDVGEGVVLPQWRPVGGIG